MLGLVLVPRWMPMLEQVLALRSMPVLKLMLKLVRMLR